MRHQPSCSLYQCFVVQRVLMKTKAVSSFNDTCSMLEEIMAYNKKTDK